MTWALAAWALAVAGTDFVRRRIPNLLLAAVLLPAAVALVVNGRGLLDAEPVTSLLGLAGGLLLLLPAYAAGWLGAGDVKLGAGLGLLLGAAGLLVCLLVAAAVLGGLSALRLARRDGRVPAGPALAAGFLTAIAIGAVG
ncbi:MAG: prepilin peptidase [Gammaproteobacteria bacterium]|nr:prepilin peptidase [Gammaproteobacteria bacterium]